MLRPSVRRGGGGEDEEGLLRRRELQHRVWLLHGKAGGERSQPLPRSQAPTGSGSGADHFAEGHARGQGGGPRTPTVAATATSPSVGTVARGPRTTRLEGLGVGLAHVLPMLHVQLELVLLHQRQDLRGGRG